MARRKAKNAEYEPNGDPMATLAVVDPYVRLAAAVLAKAAADATAGSFQACAWLTGEVASTYCDVLQLEQAVVKAYAVRCAVSCGPAGFITQQQEKASASSVIRAMHRIA